MTAQTDGTWTALQSIAPTYPAIKLFQLKKIKESGNHGSWRKEATGEVLVYVDSDSYVESEGFGGLCSPSRTGGGEPCLGTCWSPSSLKLHLENGVRAAYYVLTRVMKAAESLFGSVHLLPRSFLGIPARDGHAHSAAMVESNIYGERATFGDDRQPHQLILRTHRVVVS